MFEKEAEEIEKEAIKWVKDVFPNDEFKQSGISRALVDFAEFGYNKANERLTKAKELLTKWVELFKPKGGNIPPTPVQVETEQFLSGQPEQIGELKKMAAQEEKTVSAFILEKTGVNKMNKNKTQRGTQQKGSRTLQSERMS